MVSYVGIQMPATSHTDCLCVVIIEKEIWPGKLVWPGELCTASSHRCYDCYQRVSMKEETEDSHNFVTVLYRESGACSDHIIQRVVFINTHSRGRAARGRLNRCRLISIVICALLVMPCAVGAW